MHGAIFKGYRVLWNGILYILLNNSRWCFSLLAYMFSPTAAKLGPEAWVLGLQSRCGPLLRPSTVFSPDLQPTAGKTLAAGASEQVLIMTHVYGFILINLKHDKPASPSILDTLHHSDNTSEVDLIPYLSRLFIAGCIRIVPYAWIMSSSVSWVKLVDFYVTVVAAKKGNRCLWNPPGLLMEHNKDAIWQFLLSYHCSAHSFLTLVPQCFVVFECK